MRAFNAQPRRRAPHPAFTLMELLVVVAIIGVLMVVALPAFMKLTTAHGVDTASRHFAGILHQARQHAIANNVRARVILCTMQSPSQNRNVGAYTSYMVISEEKVSDWYGWRPLHSWQYLPQGTVFLSTNGLPADQRAGAIELLQQWSDILRTDRSSSNVYLADVGTNYAHRWRLNTSQFGGNFGTVEFLPSGQASRISTVIVAEGLIAGGWTLGWSKTTSLNHARIIVDDITGRIRIERP
jgi:prepilin-type N-terminal cleavage/methylation domain-containing protein